MEYKQTFPTSGLQPKSEIILWNYFSSGNASYVDKNWIGNFFNSPQLTESSLGIEARVSRKQNIPDLNFLFINNLNNAFHVFSSFVCLLAA